MTNLQPVRGTHDLLFDDIRRHRAIEAKAFEIAGRYGYGEIATPVFEFSTFSPDVVFTIEDLVPQGMVTLLTSQGGAGKTLLTHLSDASAALNGIEKGGDALPAEWATATASRLKADEAG